MRHYIDIHLLPDPELAPNQVLAALYGRLHLALVEQRSEHIAISFPGYCDEPGKLGLGHCLRLIGPEADLAHLLAGRRLAGLLDHVRVSAVAEVPATAQHRSLRRVQAKSNPERIRRRQMKRHGLSEAEARQRIPDGLAQHLRLPYMALHSVSTGQNFRLYLRLGPITPTPTAGPFNAYGLSTQATIPWF